MKAFKWMVVAAASAAVLGGCAYPRYGSADYGPYGVRGEQSVRFGIVESVRLVRIQPPETGVGTAAGAVIGQAIEQDANQRTGLEITVLLDNGKYIAITQEGDEQFRGGDRVRVLSGRGGTRVTH
jgi:outer membrane lipoprotein SlyB